MRQIRTKIDIDAPLEAVWKVLMEFDAYDEWNPFVQSIEGPAAEGEQLVAQLSLSGKKPMKITPIVQDVDEPIRFSWLGVMGAASLFAGHHQFDLEKTESGTRFHHYEEFSGMLAGPVLAVIRTSTTKAFNGMNKALRSRVETGA